MNARTAKIINYIRKNSELGSTEIARVFETTVQNITNIRRRYKIYIDDPALNLDTVIRSRHPNRNRERRDSFIRQSETKNTPILRYIHYILTGKSISLTVQQYKTAIMVIIAEL